MSDSSAHTLLTTLTLLQGGVNMAEATIAQYGLIFKQFFQWPQGRIHNEAPTFR
jgi:hypothetical protein